MAKELVTHRPHDGRIDTRIFALRVSIEHGPMREDFARRSQSLFRTIELKGRHTLADLHGAILAAFERESDHAYEFQIGGTEPHDPRATRYASTPSAMETVADRDGVNEAIDSSIAIDANDAPVGSLGLTVGQSFGYWFDFVDDWYHRVEVLAISDKPPRGRYPRITERAGVSPPQYPNWDEEDEELADEDWDDGPE